MFTSLSVLLMLSVTITDVVFVSFNHTSENKSYNCQSLMTPIQFAAHFPFFKIKMLVKILLTLGMWSITVISVYSDIILKHYISVCY